MLGADFTSCVSSYIVGHLPLDRVRPVLSSALLILASLSALLAVGLFGRAALLRMEARRPDARDETTFYRYAFISSLRTGLIAASVSALCLLSLLVS